MIRLDMIIVISMFSICFIFKMFSVQKKTKSRCFQFLWFEERYQNAPFSSRIGVDGSPSRRNKVLQHSVKRPKTSGSLDSESNLTYFITGKTANMALKTHQNLLSQQKREVTFILM